MTMGTLHKSFAVTGAIPTAGAAMIEGTVAHDMLGRRAKEGEAIRLGHPSGVIEIGARVEKMGKDYEFKEAILGRTARRLMEGYVLVPKRCFGKD